MVRLAILVLALLLRAVPVGAVSGTAQGIDVDDGAVRFVPSEVGSVTWGSAASKWTFETGGTNPDVDFASGVVTWNIDGDDTDFVIEGVSEPNLFVLEAGQACVGIGMAGCDGDGTHIFDVFGRMGVRGFGSCTSGATNPGANCAIDSDCPGGTCEVAAADGANIRFSSTAKDADAISTFLGDLIFRAEVGDPSGIQSSMRVGIQATGDAGETKFHLDEVGLALTGDGAGGAIVLPRFVLDLQDTVPSIGFEDTNMTTSEIHVRQDVDCTDITNPDCDFSVLVMENGAALDRRFWIDGDAGITLGSAANLNIALIAGASLASCDAVNEKLETDASGILSCGAAADGDVSGLGTSTNNAVVRWDGATGTSIQDSGCILDDTDNLNCPGTISSDDQTAEPGNLIGLRDNDTAFTNDPTCLNSGTAGELTIIDVDETAADNWQVCNGTSIWFDIPNTGADIIADTQIMVGTATTGDANYVTMSGDATLANDGTITLDPTIGTSVAWTGEHDFGGGGIEIENNTVLPGSCTVGQLFMDTDEPTGRQLFGCEGGTFVLQGDGTGAITTLNDIGDPDGTGNILATEFQQTWTWNSFGTAAAIDAFTLEYIYDPLTSDAGTQRLLVLQALDSGNDAVGNLDQLLFIQNLDTNDAVINGIAMVSAAGGITNAINLNDTDITNAFVTPNATISMAELEILDAGARTDEALCTYETTGNQLECDVNNETTLETALGGLNVVTVTTDDITSANLATLVSNEVGSGLVVFNTLADGELLDLSAINMSATGEGLRLPQTTTCTAALAAGDIGAICYGTTSDDLCVWDGTAWDCQVLGAAGGGDNITVNAVAVTDANFNNTTPAAPTTDDYLVFFDRSGTGPDSVSAYISTDRIDSSTWGLGSAFTWTFDASVGVDTTLAFGDEQFTFDNGSIDIWTSMPDNTTNTAVTWGPAITNTSTDAISNNGLNLSPDFTQTGSGTVTYRMIHADPTWTIADLGNPFANIDFFSVSPTITINDASSAINWYTLRDQTQYTTTVDDTIGHFYRGFESAPTFTATGSGDEFLFSANGANALFFNPTFDDSVAGTTITNTQTSGVFAVRMGASQTGNGTVNITHAGGLYVENFSGIAATNAYSVRSVGATMQLRHEGPAVFGEVDNLTDADAIVELVEQAARKSLKMPSGVAFSELPTCTTTTDDEGHLVFCNDCNDSCTAGTSDGEYCGCLPALDGGLRWTPLSDQGVAWIETGAMSAPSGSTCTAPVEREINSGPVTFVSSCTDVVTTSELQGKFNTLNTSYDGGPIEFTLVAENENATPSGILDFDFSCQCRGDSDTINSTWGTAVNASITFTTQFDEERDNTADATCNGTCAAGDTIYWRMILDNGATTTQVADTYILGVNVKF
jgi:hypothetical protein